MLEPIRFSTSDPGKLSQELDRFVRDVQRELLAVEARAFTSFTPREAVHGRPGVTVTAQPKLGDLLPLSAALGPIDVLLPSCTRADMGRCLLLVQRAAVSGCTLRSGVLRLNGSAGGTITLPATLAAYLLVWDGTGWWTVNDA